MTTRQPSHEIERDSGRPPSNFAHFFSGGFAVTDLVSERTEQLLFNMIQERCQKERQKMCQKNVRRYSRKNVKTNVTSDDKPQRMFERMSEDMSERLSEDMQRIALPRGSKQFRHWWWSWPRDYLRRFSTACCEWSCWSLCSCGAAVASLCLHILGHHETSSNIISRISPVHSFWHSFWHIFWNDLWQSFWRLVWQCVWHSLRTSWHSFWHSCTTSDILSDTLCIRPFILSDILSGISYVQ